MVIKDIMIPDPLTVGAHESLERVASLLFEHKVRPLPVVDERGRLVGVVSRQDCLKERLTPGADALRAEDVMSVSPECVGLMDDVGVAAGILSRRGYRALPVVSGGRVVGLVATGCLLRLLCERLAAWDTDSSPPQAASMGVAGRFKAETDLPHGKGLELRS